MSVASGVPSGGQGALPMQRGSVERKGVSIFWERCPKEGAPRLLLIRGLARSSRYWMEFRDRLEEQFDVTVFDNRGVGQSSAPRPGFTTADMADDAAAVLAASGVQRAHVFGISLGGMVAQELALRHPGRVITLTLGATRMGGRKGPRVPLSALATFARSAPMSAEETVKYTAPLVLSAAFLKERPDVPEAWGKIAASEPRHRSALVGQLLAAAMHNTTAHIHRLAMPVLILTGDADHLIHPDNSRLLHERITGSRYEILPGAGHDFPTEQPDMSARLVAEHMLSHPDGSADAESSRGAR